MKKSIIYIMVALLLHGCPAIFYGYLKNDNADKIIVSRPNDSEITWVINSGERKKTIWYQDCIIINNGTNTQYFSGWPIPDGVVKNGLFSSSLNAVYKNNSLYFETLSGELIPVPEVNKCETF